MPLELHFAALAAQAGKPTAVQAKCEGSLL
jgi:hypothetical protein